ncbi:PepSY domain-containing protein [Streptomyces subrutilus]|nr:PepSY domain-containing protein [Streptomyces subrutilus]WSJ32127.1 PepSY domain-containing protein [Streptomyces subrutilus]GGZ58323.1 hypothetical protein GCM10010371_17300 [Streptomyces subrutilus]
MKRTVYIATAASVVLMLGGPVASAAAAASTAGSATASVSTPARADATAESAVKAALKAYPGVVESVDRDGSVWHVDVITKAGKHAEVQVDAATGAVTRQERDNDDDADQHAPLLAAKVSAAQAVTAALKAHPGTVRSVDWDDGDGRAAYWDVEVKTTGGKTQNVHIDSASAKVLSSTTGDNDDDN